MIHQDQQLVMMERPLSMCWTEIASPAHPDWHRLGFPQRLYHLLNFMECNGLSHMACWGDKGTCFRIRPSQEVVQNILPYFFQQSKWKSFQRQINVYAFKRIRSGPYKGFYRHPDFSRNNVSMAHKLQRKKQRSEMPDHLPQGERDGLALPTAEASEERSLVGYGEPSINECCMAPLMHHITSPALCSSPERDVKFPKQFQFFCQEEKQAHGETDTSGVDFEIGSKLNDMAGASPAALHERSTKTSQPSSVFMSGGPFLASTVHNQGTEDHEVTKTNSLRAGRLTTTELSMFANLDWTDVLDMDEITANSDTCTGASSSSMAMVSATDVSEMSSSTSSLSWVDDDDESVVTIDDFSDLAMLEKDSMFEPLDIFPSFPSTFGHGAAVHV